jgi:hypothetical protein
MWRCGVCAEALIAQVLWLFVVVGAVVVKVAVVDAVGCRLVPLLVAADESRHGQTCIQHPPTPAPAAALTPSMRGT